MDENENAEISRRVGNVIRAFQKDRPTDEVATDVEWLVETYFRRRAARLERERLDRMVAAVLQGMHTDTVPDAGHAVDVARDVLRRLDAGDGGS